ncbi:hypothetical protein D3C80_1791580 [compost metagenome]
MAQILAAKHQVDNTQKGADYCSGNETDSDRFLAGRIQKNKLSFTVPVERTE